MSAESLAELRTWYQTHKTDLACTQAIQAMHSAPPSLKTSLKNAYPDPNATDEERELALVFALTAAATKIDMLPMLITMLDDTMFPDIAPPAVDEHALLRTRAEEAEAHALALQVKHDAAVAYGKQMEQVVNETAMQALEIAKERDALEAQLAAASTITVDVEEAPVPEPRTGETHGDLDPHAEIPAPPETQPELVPTSHVDVVPLDPTPSPTHE